MKLRALDRVEGFDAETHRREARAVPSAFIGEGTALC